MIYGELIYAPDLDRLDIKTEYGNGIGGLCCGSCIEVWLDGAWQPCRVEYGHDWVLHGLFTEGQIPRNLNVRY